MAKKILTTNPKGNQPDGAASAGQARPRMLTQTDVAGKKGITDVAYVGRYATPEDYAELRAKLEAREAALDALPDVWFYCDNPRCGFRGKYRGRDAEKMEGRDCLVCNWQSSSTGGKMRRATEAQAAAFGADLRQRNELLARQMKLSGFARQNQERTLAGLAPLTMAEFEANERKSMALMMKPPAAPGGVGQGGRR